MAELVDRIHGKVYGLCYRMLGQRQDAEDVVQETCFRVLRSLARWDPGRDFEPWVMAIAGNRCRTALVARQRRTTGRLLEDSVIDLAPPHEHPRERQGQSEGGRERLGRGRAANPLDDQV